MPRDLRTSQLERYYEVLLDFSSRLTSKDYTREEDKDELIITELITCLHQALECLEEATTKLSFYQWQDKESSLGYHLELTMSMLKGEIFTFTHACVPEYMRIIDMVSKSERTCDSMFKTAHLEVKRTVMDIAGEQRFDTRWTLRDDMLEHVHDFKKANVLKSLRVLVVCFDNLNEERRSSLSTASEIVKNREWLVKLGRVCIAAEVDKRRDDCGKEESRRRETFGFGGGGFLSRKNSKLNNLPLTPNSHSKLTRKSSQKLFNVSK
mmetsp:Transcript_6508/g.6729  ORF Transcript_6508/g.6729 Transcript_6508/m.6729 type:complete len:266 (+) Transcript_6508:188-985(+)